MDAPPLALTRRDDRELRRPIRVLFAYTPRTSSPRDPWFRDRDPLRPFQIAPAAAGTGPLRLRSGRQGDFAMNMITRIHEEQAKAEREAALAAEVAAVRAEVQSETAVEAEPAPR